MKIERYFSLYFDDFSVLVVLTVVLCCQIVAYPPCTFAAATSNSTYILMRAQFGLLPIVLSQI